MQPKVSFRPQVESDLNFILSSYAESFRRSPYSGVLPDKAYYDAARDHFSQIMKRENAQTLLCVAEGEAPPNDLFAWVVWEPGVLHYVYVKHLFRGMGVARDLLRRTGLDPTKATCTYTHRTKFSGDYLREHETQRWKYDPKAARYGRRDAK